MESPVLWKYAALGILLGLVLLIITSCTSASDNVIKSRFVYTAFESNDDCQVGTLKDLKTGACFITRCNNIAQAREDVCR